MSLPILPEPNFIARDPAAITAELVAAYEAATGKTLHEAQVERLLINQIAYRETLIRIAIQEAAKQNLLYYARAPMLDFLGQLLGVKRLAAVSARTTLRFTYPAPVVADTLIPSGTRISKEDGSLVFFTTAPGLLATGGITLDLAAECETSGPAGNGWPAAEPGILLSDLGVSGITVINVTVSTFGAAEEVDDRFRDGIAAAPEAFTTAGSRGAYRFHALRAHQSIIDIAILGASDDATMAPNPGIVRIFPLTESGLPSSDILTAIAGACSGEKVRPLCDTVQVLVPTILSYAIEVELTLLIGADAAAVLAAATAAVTAYRDDRAGGLGRDVVDSAVIAAAQVAGVYRVVVVSPVGALGIQANEWAQCTGITVTIGGFVGG